MRFDIITIFPEAFKSYLNSSILKRAQKKRLIDINIHDPRKFAKDKHKKADDRPFGGGPGMVLKIEPIARTLGSILKIKNKKSKIKNKTLVILFSAAGKQFDQKKTCNWAQKYNRIVMVAGHYEGIDERIIKILQTVHYSLQTISIGPYVLTGGELPAMVVMDAVSRHIPGVLGKRISLEERRLGIGVPVYTRPENFRWRGKNYRVPKVLLSGNHAKIEEWRRGHKRIMNHEL